MKQKTRLLKSAVFLLLSFALLSKPAWAIDPIIVPLPVLNVYNAGSYFQLTVASEDESSISATLTLGDQSSEQTLNADSTLFMEHVVNGVSQGSQIRAYPEGNGFVIQFTNIGEGQVVFSVEGGEELSSEITQDTVNKIILSPSKSSKLQLIYADSSSITVDSNKTFFTLDEGFAIPIRFASDASGPPVNTTGGGGGTGGEPDKGAGGDPGDVFPLGSAAGGCALQGSSSSASSSLISLMLLGGLVGSLARRRKLARIKS